MNSDEDIERLERKVAQLEENMTFLRDLLGHIKGQFEEFRKDIERRK